MKARPPHARAGALTIRQRQAQAETASRVKSATHSENSTDPTYPDAFRGQRLGEHSATQPLRPEWAPWQSQTKAAQGRRATETTHNNNNKKKGRKATNQTIHEKRGKNPTQNASTASDPLRGLGPSTHGLAGEPVRGRGLVSR